MLVLTWRGTPPKPSSCAAGARKKITTAMGRLDFVTDRTCQRHLGNFARKIRALQPITRRRAKTMRRQITPIETAQQHQDGHVAERSTAPVPREHDVVAFPAVYTLA